MTTPIKEEKCCEKCHGIHPNADYVGQCCHNISCPCHTPEQPKKCSGDCCDSWDYADCRCKDCHPHLPSEQPKATGERKPFREGVLQYGNMYIRSVEETGDTKTDRPQSYSGIVAPAHSKDWEDEFSKRFDTDWGISDLRKQDKLKADIQSFIASLLETEQEQAFKDRDRYVEQAKRAVDKAYQSGKDSMEVLFDKSSYEKGAAETLSKIKGLIEAEFLKHDGLTAWSRGYVRCLADLLSKIEKEI